jgi:hypothetical protein
MHLKYTFIALCFLCSFQLFSQLVNAEKMKKDLITIGAREGFRTYKDTATLNAVAKFMRNELAQYADTIFEQAYTVNGIVYKNIIASFGIQHTKRIVLGAHYDVCGDQAGADDNGSGLVGLLEIARLLKGKTLANRIDVVAFTLEEPPFFKTKSMGSYQYAKSLYDARIPVLGMVSFDMIGYFDDKKGSQSYPIGLLKWKYGSSGNFITLASRYKKGRFARDFGRRFIESQKIKTVKFSAPSWLPITDRSDHRCFWGFGYSALLITDTALWRNHAYHKAGDTIEKLNFEKMASVVEATYLALMEVCNATK